MDDFNPSEIYDLQKTLELSAHISSLAFGHAGHLFVGSEDGSLRVYDLSSYKVIKAIRVLGAEVSSIVPLKRPGSELRDVWLACGSRIMNFRTDTDKIIQTAEDALEVIELGESGEDILNELALHVNKSHIAFSMDSGVVGVVDLSTKAVSRMKVKHESVCGSVLFIPHRPREIVSGGFDMALLHFDFLEGKLLSSRKMSTYSQVGGMTLAPPFVTSTAISSTDFIAAGTSDGRLWIGCGGQKIPGKKKRKWDGLNEDESTALKIAEGPLVAMAFDELGILTVSTLMGVVSRHTVVWDEKEHSIQVDKILRTKTQRVRKVNALIVDTKRVIVGGLTADGNGALEIWKRSN